MFKRDEFLLKMHVEELDSLLFRGETLEMGLPRVFGGQVLGQALNAAVRTVGPDRTPHSLHSYFLRPGDLTRPIIYEVDPIRNGRSFSTRRVVAKQKGEAIFNASISFQIAEDGLSHQFDFPENVQHYSELPNDFDRAKEVGNLMGISEEKFRSYYLIFGTDILEMRTPGLETSIIPGEFSPTFGFWFKFNDAIGKNATTHQTLLAFISDKALMSTALRPHPVNFRTHKIIGASLDHAMWFHEEIDVTQWIYYHIDSPRSAGSRGFNRGSFYTEDGRLIASTAQEGLIRVVGENN
ncbi:acyl-CoA thioesterase II [Litorimonas cladophorae]|uniref:Acyl-CoA thioesterase 2 n=1 Tax=Litorimonas cladophorae TaxID=1220491 RepID=A0A918KNC6_9PROT|nr:acyl-CoA thioesterase II [Litorimonas cladophorae]GGX70214.1 acyl-CoA thioesterase II [Litorimonas cladophorae]